MNIQNKLKQPQHNTQKISTKRIDCPSSHGTAQLLRHTCTWAPCEDCKLMQAI